MSAPCAACDGKKAASVHSRWHPEFHKYSDSTKGGIKGESDGKREYRQSQAHRDAYEAAVSPACLAGLAGAPGRCSADLTPHHVAGRGASGGQAAAERIAPVITLCSYHNSAIEGDVSMRRWAEANYFERDGVEWPFRMRARLKPPVKEEP